MCSVHTAVCSSLPLYLNNKSYVANLRWQKRYSEAKGYRALNCGEGFSFVPIIIFIDHFFPVPIKLLFSKVVMTDDTYFLELPT